MKGFYFNGFEKTECVGKKLKNITTNVSAMSSGGFGTTHYQNTTNDNRKHRLTK
jgi:hypothetical protein